MKKIALILLSLCAIALLVGCQGKDNKSSDNAGGNQNALKDYSVADDADAKNKITYKMDGKPVKDSSVFGENTYVFTPKDSKKKIQKTVSSVYNRQVRNQFGEERYTLMFMPGDYDDSLEVKVGYYTQVLGMGIRPTQTNINKLWVDANWMQHNATCNFWRSAENFSIDAYCMWANSQAVSMRKVNSSNGAVLSDGEGWSSGGFIADSKFDGTVSSGSQQQYLFRNDQWNYFENGVWNMVYVGVDKNTVPMGGWPYQPYTKVGETPYTQEKPYLCYDEKNGFGVMVQDSDTNTQGVSWAKGVKGTFYGLGNFYIADPKKDSADTINEALESGKNILLTPGIYKVEKPIEVKKADTIIYGMGLATLQVTKGTAGIQIGDVDGVKVCGILLDAGEKESETLLQVGEAKTDKSHAKNPIILSDVYFRVGGGELAGKVKSCLTINSNNVVGDNLWVWRADHSDNVGWDVNTAPNGVIINGDDVTMYGLFVEHFQEYQTIWNGNGGKCYFYQSEMPYDAPDQKSYKSSSGKNGWASFKVADDVKEFEATGLGIYCYNRDADVKIASAMEVPAAPKVKINNVCTVKLNGQGEITHIVNNLGERTTQLGNAYRIMKFGNGKIIE